MTLNSRLSRTLTITALCAMTAGAAHAQSAFKAGDLVIYRVGTGAAALTSSATAVFLDEYSPTGSLVQSIAMPTADLGSQHSLTASGSATSEGLLTLGSNGQYLALTGYDSAPSTVTGIASTPTNSLPGTTGTGTVTARTIGVIGANGVVDTSTALNATILTGNNIRSAVTNDGNNIYIGDAQGGVDYTTIGSTGTAAPIALETALTNARSVVIANGQLYASTGSGTTYRIVSVGTGTPTTSGQTISELPGSSPNTIPTTSAFSPYAFSFATLNVGSTSPDTLYVAENTAGVIDKYSLVGGNWIATGAITGISNITGLTVSVTNGAASLFATSATGFFHATDATGFDVSAAGAATQLVTVGTNEAFRGVAFAPQAAIGAAATPEPSVFAFLAEAAAVGAGWLVVRKRRTA